MTRPIALPLSFPAFDPRTSPVKSPFWDSRNVASSPNRRRRVLAPENIRKEAMMMRPLIQSSLFDDFRALREHLPQKPAYAFVPVSEPERDLLFIGQATSGMVYETDLDYTAATRECTSMLTNFLRSPRGAFWQSVCRIREQVSRIAMPSGNTAAIGWSNLCKIGAAEGNPKPIMIIAQSRLSVELLQQELRTANPKVTIFLTGNFGTDEILYPAVGNDGWRNNVAEENRVAVKYNSTFGLLLWGYHPKSKHGMTHLRELEAFIAGFAASHLLHHYCATNTVPR